MKSQVLKLSVVATALALLVTAGAVFAQKQGAKGWYATAKIKRVKKPDRNTGNIPKTPVTASLLQIQWNLFKRGNGNKAEIVDPRQMFPDKEQVKLALTANQDGYLYIINQPEGKDGILLFPHPLANEGKNFIKKDQEYLVPYRYEGISDPNDCWMDLLPPAGTETMIVIFSRDQISTLPNEVTKPYDVVKPEVVANLKAASQQRVKKFFGNLPIPGRKTVPFATRVRNANTNDNEDLITTIEIKHGGNQAQVATRRKVSHPTASPTSHRRANQAQVATQRKE